MSETELSDEELWRALTKEFATWRFFLPRPRDFVIASTRYGSDYSRGTLKLTYWKKGRALLEGAPQTQVMRLKARSALNLRQVDNYLRYMFYIFLSIPIALSVATSQLFPEIWAGLDASAVEAWFTVIAAWAGLVFFFFAGSWKARELDMLLTYALALRGVSMDDAPEEPTDFELPGP